MIRIMIQEQLLPQLKLQPHPMNDNLLSTFLFHPMTNGNVCDNSGVQKHLLKFDKETLKAQPKSI